MRVHNANDKEAHQRSDDAAKFEAQGWLILWLYIPLVEVDWLCLQPFILWPLWLLEVDGLCRRLVPWLWLHMMKVLTLEHVLMPEGLQRNTVSTPDVHNVPDFHSPRVIDSINIQVSDLDLSKRMTLEQRPVALH